MKKIGQNKFQFFFFVGVLTLLLVTLVVASVLDKPVVDNPGSPEDPTIQQPEEKPTINDTVQVVKYPFGDIEFQVVRKFYDRNSSTADQEMSLIRFGNSYRTSVGTSFAEVSGKTFQVLAALKGTVIEIKESPLYSNYVVVDHGNNIKTYYYGLSEVTIPVGAVVNQGDCLGVSGRTEIDQDAGNHVYFQVRKGDKNLDPEKLFGKKISEI